MTQCAASFPKPPHAPQEFSSSILTPTDGMQKHQRTAGRLAPASAAAAAAAAASPASKRPSSFKAKLQSLKAEAQGHGEEQLLDRRALAVACLVDGRAACFVDFFMLSQPTSSTASICSSSVEQPAAGASSSSNAGGAAAATEVELPWPSLVLLQQQLVAADVASRAGDARAAFAAHRTLAKHFTTTVGVPRNAIFFWRRALQVAVDAAWAQGELEAQCALGLLHEAQGQAQLAIASHERCLQLATGAEDVAAAHGALVQVYAQQAEQHGRQGNAEAAAAFYCKCRDAALDCGDAAAAGAASHHLGLIAQAEGRWEAALEHQRAYMALARQAGDQEAEGRACVAAADCQQQLGQLADAVASLEAFLGLARSQAPHAHASACATLGVLLQQQGQLQQAVVYFERFFEVARSMGVRQLLDTARAHLGAARAALRIERYKALAWDSDTGGLLAWKSCRQPFT